jgi:hypothetical protein
MFILGSVLLEASAPGSPTCGSAYGKMPAFGGTGRCQSETYTANNEHVLDDNLGKSAQRGFAATKTEELNRRPQRA